MLFGAAAPLALLAPTPPSRRRRPDRRPDPRSRDLVGDPARVPDPAPPDRRRGRRADHDLRLRDGADRVGAQSGRPREARPTARRRWTWTSSSRRRRDFWSNNPSHAVDRGHKTRGGVGRMVRRKGFDTLLDAWELLGRQASPMAGRGSWCWWAMVPNAAASSGRHAARGLGGSRSPGPWILRASWPSCRVPTCSPSRSGAGWADWIPRAWGLATLEASACGLPVVVGRSGGAPETVQPGRTGLRRRPGRPVRARDRLADLFADPARARELGAAGRVSSPAATVPTGRVAYSVPLLGARRRYCVRSRRGGVTPAAEGDSRWPTRPGTASRSRPRPRR